MRGVLVTALVAATVTVALVVTAGSSSAVSPNVNPKPGAPTGVTAIPGDGSASVSWTAPIFTGNAPINSYTAKADGLGCTTTGTTCVISGLTNGKTYKVRVRATNGDNARSAANNPAALVKVGTPTAPTGVTVAGGNGQVLVSWTPADGNGSAITNYDVVASPGPRGCNTDTTSCTVPLLTNGTPYTFTVTATNSLGTGPASPPSASATPATVPGAPTSVVATAGNGSASVSFNAPSSNGGSDIESYTVTAADSTTPANGGETATGSASPLNVTGLTNGDSYTFTVTATNGVGPGAGATSAAVIPATVPDAPTDVSAAPDADNDAGVLLVSFTPGFDEGSTILEYTVTITDQTNPGDPNNGLTVSGSGSPITVGGLTSGDAYSFTVTATNGVGTGASSSPSSGVASP
jgi:hypothetical protein